MRARTPHVSKFRDHPFDFSDDERRDLYVEHVERERPLARGQRGGVLPRDVRGVEATTARAAARSGTSATARSSSSTRRRSCDELPGAHFLHVVRNPWSAYADTKKRPVPLSLAALHARLVPEPALRAARARALPRPLPPPAHRGHARGRARPSCASRIGLERLGRRWRRRAGTASRSPRCTRGGRSGRRRQKRTAPPPRSSPRRSATRCASGPACSWRRWATTTSSPDAVLVTGAAGFVGANLVRRLLADGARVVALVRPGATRGGSRGSTWTWSRPTCASRSPAALSLVYHLASHGAYSWQDDEATIRETNVLGTENALRAGRAGRRGGVVVRVRAQGPRARRGRGARAEQPLRGREGGGDRARAASGARSCCGSTPRTGPGRSRTGSCRRCSARRSEASCRRSCRRGSRGTSSTSTTSARRSSPLHGPRPPAASTTWVPAGRPPSPKSSRPCERSLGVEAEPRVGLDARPQLGHRDVGLEPGTDPRRARLGGADRARRTASPARSSGSGAGAARSATWCS